MAEVTILISKNMQRVVILPCCLIDVNGFAEDGVAGSGKVTVMTTFAAAVNAGMVECCTQETAGYMA